MPSARRRAPSTFAWSFLIKERRSYAGNLGYDDIPDGVYLYDSNVANSRQVREGDLVLIRDGEGLLGVSRVDRIQSSNGTKVIRRCPTCTSSTIKSRSTRAPRFRCYTCAHEFQKAKEEKVEVVEYAADYQSSFIPLPGVLSRERIKSAAFRPATQLSIERIDLTQIESALRASDPRVRALLEAAAHRRGLGDFEADRPLPSDAGEGISDGYEMSSADTREKILRQICQRRGQQKFRGSLLQRYGSCCQITRCTALAVLEAAHIWPYRGAADNDLRNGLILRADLHTLFDLNLIAIHPDTLRVHLSENIMTIPEYSSLEGRSLHIVPGLQPSKAPLQRRWSVFDRELT